MRWLVLLAAAWSSGCSYTFDGGAPDLPLVGAVPDTANLPRLNQSPAFGGASILWGADGVPWGVWDELVDSSEGGKIDGLHFRRLSDPPLEEVLAQDKASNNGPAFYWVDKPTDPVPTALTLHIHVVGAG